MMGGGGMGGLASGLAGGAMQGAGGANGVDPKTGNKPLTWKDTPIGVGTLGQAAQLGGAAGGLMGGTGGSATAAPQMPPPMQAPPAMPSQNVAPQLGAQPPQATTAMAQGRDPMQEALLLKILQGTMT
jgi:hypothetical protein